MREDGKCVDRMVEAQHRGRPEGVANEGIRVKTENVKSELYCL